MPNIKVFATQQGLYSVDVDGTLRALISNAGGRWEMREARRRDFKTETVGDRTLDVTSVLHNAERLNEAIVAFLDEAE